MEVYIAKTLKQIQYRVGNVIKFDIKQSIKCIKLPIKCQKNSLNGHPNLFSAIDLVPPLTIQ
jgi:hypothetical protein